MVSVDSWAVILATGVLLVVALLCSRLRVTAAMPSRSRGRVDVRERRSRVCPHIGLSDDPLAHQDSPTEQHRCFLWEQRDRIDVSHQMGFCLSAAHRNCPWLTIVMADRTPTQRLGLACVSKRLESAVSLPQAGGGRLARGLVKGCADLRRLTGLLQRSLTILSFHALRLACHAGKRGRVVLLRVAARTIAAAALGSHTLHRVRQHGREKVGARQAMGSSDEIAERATENGVAEAIHVQRVEAPLLNYSVLQSRGEGNTLNQENMDLLEQGLAAAECGDEDEANRLFSRATELDPDCEAAWSWRARTATSLTELIWCFERALAINPENVRVKSDLISAMERRETEQQRRRYAQPFDMGTDPIAGDSRPPGTSMALPAGRGQAKQSDVRTLHWIAGLTSLFLAVYWLWGALVSTIGPPPLPAAELLARVLPTFSLSDATMYDSFELVPGYNLLDAVPFVVGFLSVFVAGGLFRREQWAPLWGISLAVATVASAVCFVSNSAAVVVGAILCMILAAGIVVGRKEFAAVAGRFD